MIIKCPECEQIVEKLGEYKVHMQQNCLVTCPDCEIRYKHIVTFGGESDHNCIQALKEEIKKLKESIPAETPQKVHLLDETTTKAAYDSHLLKILKIALPEDAEDIYNQLTETH